MYSAPRLGTVTGYLPMQSRALPLQQADRQKDMRKYDIYTVLWELSVLCCDTDKTHSKSD